MVLGGGGSTRAQDFQGPQRPVMKPYLDAKTAPLMWRLPDVILIGVWLRSVTSGPPPHPPPPPSPPSRPPLRHRLALSEGAHVCVFTRGFRLFVHFQKRQRHRWVAWWRLHPSATVKRNARTVRGRLLASRWMYSLLWAPLKDLLTGD